MLICTELLMDSTQYVQWEKTIPFHLHKYFYCRFIILLLYQLYTCTLNAECFSPSTYLTEVSCRCSCVTTNTAATGGYKCKLSLYGLQWARWSFCSICIMYSNTVYHCMLPEECFNMLHIKLVRFFLSILQYSCRHCCVSFWLNKRLNDLIRYLSFQVQCEGCMPVNISNERERSDKLWNIYVGQSEYGIFTVSDVLSWWDHLVSTCLSAV